MLRRSMKHGGTAELEVRSTTRTVHSGTVVKQQATVAQSPATEPSTTKQRTNWLTGK